MEVQVNLRLFITLRLIIFDQFLPGIVVGHGILSLRFLFKKVKQDSLLITSITYMYALFTSLLVFFLWFTLACY